MADPMKQMVEDVFKHVQSNKPLPLSDTDAFINYLNRNKRKTFILVAVGISTALVTVATGGLAAVGVGVFVGMKGLVFIGKRCYRAIKSKYYMKPINAITEELKKIQNNPETLAVQRVGRDLVARDALEPLLKGLRNEIQHSRLTKVMNDYEAFEQARAKYDENVARLKGGKIESCGQAVKLLEFLGQMSRHYHALSTDFELLCELATFIMLKKTQMDEDFRTHIDNVMTHLSGCYGRPSPQFDPPLIDLLNEAANSGEVLRHWNEFGGKDHRKWIGAVLGVEGKTNILSKYVEMSSRDQRPTSATALSGVPMVAAIGGGSTGVSTGAKLVVDSLGWMSFDPSAIAGGAAVGAGGALLSVVAEAANERWNRYMLRTGKKLSFTGWKDLTPQEVVRLYRGEAKREIETLVEKLTHLMKAHEQWLTDARHISTFSKGFSTLLIPATQLMRRQKLYWQIFHAGSGLFVNFAQFYEHVAFPTVLAQARYIREDADEHSEHAKLEDKIHAWLTDHATNGPCADEVPCYMTVGQLAEFKKLPAPRCDPTTPIRPLGAATAKVELGAG